MGGMKKMVRERTLFEKTIYEATDEGTMKKVLSRTVVVDGAERHRDYIEGESKKAASRASGHWESIGWWRRLTGAVRKYGLPQGKRTT